MFPEGRWWRSRLPIRGICYCLGDFGTFLGGCYLLGNSFGSSFRLGQSTTRLGFFMGGSSLDIWDSKQTSRWGLYYALSDISSGTILDTNTTILSGFQHISDTVIRISASGTKSLFFGKGGVGLWYCDSCLVVGGEENVMYTSLIGQLFVGGCGSCGSWDMSIHQS